MADGASNADSEECQACNNAQYRDGDAFFCNTTGLTAPYNVTQGYFTFGGTLTTHSGQSLCPVRDGGCHAALRVWCC